MKGGNMKIGKLVFFVSAITLLSISLAFAGVLEGKKLFEDPKFAGSTNEKSCNSCHPGGSGLQKAGEKTSFTIMGKQKDSLEDTVNLCIQMALKGKPISKDSQKMKDIVSYVKSLKGKKIKKKRVITGC
jgi:cytochrome c